MATTMPRQRPRFELPLRAALAVLALAAPSMSRAAGCERARFKIVLDIGHTEEAPGATSARGISELTYNRQLGAVVAARLVRDGFTSVTVLNGRLSGHQDLMDRALRANTVAPDAFLSLHHDAVQPAYLTSWTTDDGLTRRYSDRFSGYSLFVSRRNAQPARSLSLAQDVATELLAGGLHFSRYHAEKIRGENRPWADSTHGIYAFDDLVVLKHVAAPAVLLESGFIVNRDEELILASDERRSLVAGALSAAFAKFCEVAGTR